MKTYLKFFIILSIIFCHSNILYSSEKIAFIDLEYVYVNSNAGKKIIDKINLEIEKNNKNFAIKKKNFEKMKEDLFKRKNVISEKEFTNQFNILDSQIKSFNNEVILANNETQKLNVKAKSVFSKNLAEILSIYAKENSIQIIINKNNILLGMTELDISKDILQLFNKDVKEILLN